jgi:hypothetical protein
VDCPEEFLVVEITVHLVPVLLGGQRKADLTKNEARDRGREHSRTCVTTPATVRGVKVVNPMMLALPGLPL